MPMMDDLITKLNETPPQNEAELEAMLGETGYALTALEPTMAEEEAEDDMGMMAEDEEIEAEEDMGPMEEGEGEMEMSIMEEMGPIAAMMGGAPPNPRMAMKKKTHDAAKKALREG